MNVSSRTRTSVPTRLDSRCNAARESLTDAPQMTSRSSTRLWSLMTALWRNSNDFHPSRCVPSEIGTCGSRHGGQSTADHVRRERESRSRHSRVRSVWVRVLRDRRVIDGLSVHAESGERWTTRSGSHVRPRCHRTSNVAVSVDSWMTMDAHSLSLVEHRWAGRVAISTAGVRWLPPDPRKHAGLLLFGITIRILSTFAFSFPLECLFPCTVRVLWAILSIFLLTILAVREFLYICQSRVGQQGQA